MTTWIVIPARGGSQTVTQKNAHPLGDFKLYEYVIRAARYWNGAHQIIVNTDILELQHYAQRHGLTVIRRRPELAGPEVPIWDVLKDMITIPGTPADTVVLLQPTSPFVTPMQIQECCKLLWDPQLNAASVQTVVKCPHNHHAWNQRRVIQNRVEWVFKRERKKAFQKQLKRPHYLFGNLLAFWVPSALEQDTLWPEPSLAYHIPFEYGLDIDELRDFATGEMYLRDEAVILPHMMEDAFDAEREGAVPLLPHDFQDTY